MPLKLPIGIQNFEELRTKDYLYIDKTEYYFRLIDQGKYYFLSRPRRFGKSLLISTLAAIFEGKRELFEGLWIYDKIDWATYPVIRIDFTADSVKEAGLKHAIRDMIDMHAERFGISLTKGNNRGRLGELIIKLHELTGSQAVVLIDEYDKPIVDNLENIPQAEENRDILKDFYGVLKPLDPHLKFVFLTGVTKFSKIAIFSDLNNLNDITTHQAYSTMLGLTKEEINRSFADRIPDVCKQLSLTKEQFDEQLKFWYNGYSWDAKNFVYNPFSILRFFDAQQFENFWFSTGTPTFLVNFIKEKGIAAADIEQRVVDSTFFDKFDITDIDVIALLFQTGYLTIKTRDEYNDYLLGYPNEEVRLSFMSNLLEAFSHRVNSDVKPKIIALREALKTNDIELFIDEINALFASIPHHIFIANKEAYYHSIVYLALRLLGVYINTEVSTARGRIDAVVKTDDYLYVMEFKLLPATAANALAQIKEKGYAEPYKTDARELILLGITFDPDTRKISEVKQDQSDENK